VGDWLNDISMLKEAGLGVAMGQAPDEVKAAADHVTASIDEDGLAEAIRKFILS
jgi:hydroxymethylpyrimidine pyrophosphatase-like HAD family hydrolase